nr:hypothetical protein [uncultured Anaeromusa sp.]
MVKQQANPKEPKLALLFDGDMFAYIACAKAEEEWTWPNGLHSIWSQEGECITTFDDDVCKVALKVLQEMKWEGPYEIMVCFSDPTGNYFRKHIYPSYKANRADKRKPLCYTALVDWVKQHYQTLTIEGLEADDLLGILSTGPKEPEGSPAVIISKDKDFNCIPGWFYSMTEGKLKKVSEEEADRFHLYQTLIGDTCDNYPGCPGVGPVKAEKVLKEGTWVEVAGAFEKAKLPESQALLMARVARILRYGEFNAKEGVKLWEPVSSS